MIPAHTKQGMFIKKRVSTTLKLGVVATFLAVTYALTPITVYAQSTTPSSQQLAEAVVLTGKDLSLEQILRVARDKAPVHVSPGAQKQAERSHQLLLLYGKQGKPVYGLNRGVGQNKDKTIFEGDSLSADARQLSEAFNKNMLLSHTVAYGPIAPVDVVRATMLIRLNTALYGGTGMSPELIQQYVNFLNAGLTPVVRSRGSIGAADITILPQIGLAMMGEGEIILPDGQTVDASAALEQYKLTAARPFAKDGLSLLSSNAYGAAQAILAVQDMEQVMERADDVMALSLEGLNGNIAPLLPPTQSTRPYPYQQRTAEGILQRLEGSSLWQQDPERHLQDPLSYRSTSQVHGAARNAIENFKKEIQLQVNSSDDNPTVVLDVKPGAGASSQVANYFVQEGDLYGAVLPSAAFDTTVWVLPLHNVSLAASHVAQSSAQRILRLSDPNFSKLSRFLSPNDTTLAYTTIQKPVSTLSTEIRALAQIASSDALVVAGNIEDIANNGPIVAQRLHEQVDLLYTLLGIELMHAAQAADLRQRANPDYKLGKGTQQTLTQYRQSVPFLDADRMLSIDIEKSHDFLRHANH